MSEFAQLLKVVLNMFIVSLNNVVLEISAETKKLNQTFKFNIITNLFKTFTVYANNENGHTYIKLQSDFDSIYLVRSFSELGMSSTVLSTVS